PPPTSTLFPYTTLFRSYRLGNAGFPPDPNIDPGRVRYQPFFLKMYGDCRKGETAATMTNVVWLPRKWGKPVRVTRINGVAAQLRSEEHTSELQSRGHLV